MWRASEEERPPAPTPSYDPWELGTISSEGGGRYTGLQCSAVQGEGVVIFHSPPGPAGEPLIWAAADLGCVTLQLQAAVGGAVQCDTLYGVTFVV